MSERKVAIEGGYTIARVLVYVLGIFSRSHENKVDDVEGALEGYMKHHEWRSSRVRPDGVIS